MTSTIVTSTEPGRDPEDTGRGLGRRRFLGYVLGGSTLITAAEPSFAGSATADGM